MKSDSPNPQAGASRDPITGVPIPKVVPNNGAFVMCPTCFGLFARLTLCKTGHYLLICAGCKVRTFYNSAESCTLVRSFLRLCAEEPHVLEALRDRVKTYYDRIQEES
jgi:hypothetical protein